ncbi:phage head-tail joining protein [Mesorhizobium sp. PUT5]|uniref:phage head-tail joining protein n=1 Tax=Mesorhizobium sp. PUT5 TaxID=3454629 RepID=UPI003FA4C462
MTHAELLEQRASLIEARNSGALRIVFHSGGTRREVEYRSVREIQAAIDAIDRDIAANAGTRINVFYPTFSKGFDE